MNKKEQLVILIYIALSVIICTPLFAEGTEERAKTGIAGITILDLETAKRIALKKKPSHLGVKIRIEQAREKVTQARAANFPAIDAQMSLTKNDFPTYSGLAVLMGLSNASFPDGMELIPLKQADLNIGIARSEYYPTISLNGSYTGQRERDAGY